MWSSNDIPNPLGWPLYDKYKKSEMDLPPGEEPSRENNYGNLNLPEVPSAEIKPLWDYMKEKTGFDYELFHSGNMPDPDLPVNPDGSWGDIFGSEKYKTQQNENLDAAETLLTLNNNSKNAEDNFDAEQLLDAAKTVDTAEILSTLNNNTKNTRK